MARMMIVLAQARPSRAWGPSIEVLVWSGILLIAAVALVLAAVWLRRRMTAEDQVGPELPFTLDELRKLHQAGDLSDQQYQRARERIIALTDPEAASAAGSPAAWPSQDTSDPPPPGDFDQGSGDESADEDRNDSHKP
jgi:hypothetical protein